MHIHNAAPPQSASLYDLAARHRLTFGSVRELGRPAYLNIVLPAFRGSGAKPAVLVLRRGERLGEPELRALADAVASGATGIVMTDRLDDAFAAFGIINSARAGLLDAEAA